MGLPAGFTALERRLVLEGGLAELFGRLVALEGGLTALDVFWTVLEGELTVLDGSLMMIKGPLSAFSSLPGSGFCTPTAEVPCYAAQRRRSQIVRRALTLIAYITSSLALNLLLRQRLHDEAVLLLVLCRETKHLEANEAG